MNNIEPIIETERFYLRKISLDDIDILYKMECTPEVNRYTGEILSTTISEFEEKIKQTSQRDYRLYGYGRWAVVDKKTNDFIGWAGLKYLPELEQTDLGYRFFPEYWGQGIGTEVSKAIVAYGFEKLAIQRIIALALPDNIASIRIMEKIGMKYEKSAPYEEGDEDIAEWYFIDKNDWEADNK